MIVMKFGGSSLGSSIRFQETSKIIINKVSDKPIIIVSAINGITNKLIQVYTDKYFTGAANISEINR